MASEISTKFLPESPNELFDRLKLLLREKQAGKNSILNNVEIVVIAESILEYNCISTKQRNVLILKCLNWMKTLKFIKICQNAILLGVFQLKLQQKTHQ